MNQTELDRVLKRGEELLGREMTVRIGEKVDRYKFTKISGTLGLGEGKRIQYYVNGEVKSKKGNIVIIPLNVIVLHLEKQEKRTKD